MVEVVPGFQFCAYSPAISRTETLRDDGAGGNNIDKIAKGTACLPKNNFVEDWLICQI